MKPDLVTLHCVNATNRALPAYPVTHGVPLPAGALRTTAGLAARLENGRLAPVQTRVLQRYLDGSIQWLLLDFEVPLAKNSPACVTLTRARLPARAGIKVKDGRAGVTVSTPHYTVTLSKRAFSLFASYRAGGRELIAPGSDIVVEDLQGKRFYGSNCRAFSVRVAEAGPLRVVIEVAGRHTAGDDAELLEFRVRYTFRCHDPCVQLSYKFTNREPPEQGVAVGSIRITVPTALGRQAVNLLRQNNTGDDWFSRRVAVRENVEILAGKPVNELASKNYGVVAQGRTIVRNLDNFRENPAEYPYFLRPGNLRTDVIGGLYSAYPYVAATGGGVSALGWFAEMEFHFPKATAADRNLLSFDIWPAWAGKLQVRRGQAKEHDLFLGLLAGERSHAELESLYHDHEYQGYGGRGMSSWPVTVTLDPAHVRATRALDLQRWLAFDETRYVALEQKLGTYAPPVFADRGMLDYGDRSTPDRAWSANNENDVILNTLREYYRRAAPLLLRDALAMARHNAHVDFIAFDPDNPLRRGTMPAHCPEHTDGATYPSHMWVGGLLAAYTATGNEDYRAAAIAVGDNMRRWQQQRPVIFYGDSRECGWPMLAWLQLHEHTHDRRWLKACRQVFEYYRDAVNKDGVILHELPHGVGIYVGGYGEFIAWRSLFFYYERTGEKDVRDLLVKALDKVYRCTPAQSAAFGWGSSDLFPAWAAYTLTGNEKYLADNYPFLEYLMKQPGNFPWAGVDMHYFLAELDRRGELERFCR